MGFPSGPRIGADSTSASPAIARPSYTMRPVNQCPLSLKDIKRSPFASSRHPDSPPNRGKDDVSTSPLRNSSAPNRTRPWSCRSNQGMELALTSIDTGAGLELSSDWPGETGGGTNCALATLDAAAADKPAAASCRKARREPRKSGSGLPRRITRKSGVQPAPRSCRGRRGPVGLAEQFGQFLGDGAAKFFGVHNGDRAAIIARDVMADADGDQLDRRTRLDFLDNVTQVPLQIVARIDRQRGIVDRRTIGNHHQDLALLGATEQALVRPIERLAIDVFLQQTFAHHQAEILARAPPGRVGRFIDDVPQVVQTAGVGRLAGSKPRLARL